MLPVELFSQNDSCRGRHLVKEKEKEPSFMIITLFLSFFPEIQVNGDEPCQLPTYNYETHRILTQLYITHLFNSVFLRIRSISPFFSSDAITQCSSRPLPLPRAVFPHRRLRTQ